MDGGDLYNKEAQTPVRRNKHASRISSGIYHPVRPASVLSMSSPPPSNLSRLRPRSSMADIGKRYGSISRFTVPRTPSRLSSRSVAKSSLRGHPQSTIRSVSGSTASLIASPSFKTPRFGRRLSSSLSNSSSCESSSQGDSGTTSTDSPSGGAGSSGSSFGTKRSTNIYTGHISVSVRPRPLNEKDGPNSWIINPEASCVYNKEVGEFFYDHVFEPTVSNTAVYLQTVQPIVKKCLQGFNGTVFAYGMTGSGKTYSMQGVRGQTGVISLCVHEIFEYFHSTTRRGALNKVSCSYLEIYNEKLYDLLDPEGTFQLERQSTSVLRRRPATSMANPSSRKRHISSSKSELRICDDPTFGINVVGLTEFEAPDADSLLRIIRSGDSMRRTGGTNYNARSSRSHAIVLIHLSTQNAPGMPKTASTLCLCDLAGSEKVSSKLERRTEGSYINKSLLALGTVISKLSKGSSSHIPYRDSKLTRILQPSLSGSSLISILCTIHLSSQTFPETVNTLRFASRAKNIAYRVHRTEHSENKYDEKYVETLIKENEKLTKEIHTLKEKKSTKGHIWPDAISSTSIVSRKYDERTAELVAENKMLSEQLEHQKRLNEESQMEHVVDNNESLQELVRVQVHYDVTDESYNKAITNLDNFGKHCMTKMEEMKSYIMHLEQKLRDLELKDALKEIKTGPSAAEITALDNVEEITELKRMLKSKDMVIKALKTANSMREIFDSSDSNDENKALTSDYLKPIDNIVKSV